MTNKTTEKALLKELQCFLNSKENTEIAYIEFIYSRSKDPEDRYSVNLYKKDLYKERYSSFNDELKTFKTMKFEQINFNTRDWISGAEIKLANLKGTSTLKIAVNFMQKKVSESILQNI